VANFVAVVAGHGSLLPLLPSGTISSKVVHATTIVAFSTSWWSSTTTTTRLVVLGAIPGDVARLLAVVTVSVIGPSTIVVELTGAVSGKMTTLSAVVASLHSSFRAILLKMATFTTAVA